MRVILASGSPRRKELLKLVVPEFEVIVSNVEETLKEGLTPEEQVKRLSYIKAKDVFDKTEGDRIVIGSDTMVAKNDQIYGKPKNKEHAKEMIKELINGDKTHKVITGLSVLVQENEQYKEHITYDEVIVHLKDISEEEIDEWINTGHAMDKAAAYSIQDEFCVFIEKIEGNFTTVVGLPTHKLYDIIKE
ncbi:MAG: septum formation protein Maf [Bacilli bacterium]|nr:septum formation protein Maf [Bacilli bacterium]